MRTNVLLSAIGLTALAASAHPIDFDQIRHWTGSGPNRAALVIQYNGNVYGTDSYVWGYRWGDGETPTGETMMKAICANSSRLSMLTQYTGSMGSTLCGVGYSLNQEILSKVFFNFDKAKDFEFINFDYYEANSFMGQKEAPGDNAPMLAQAAIDASIAGTHYIQHPFDYGKYGYPAYDYDCWDIDEETESIAGISRYEPKWLSAWYEGYWSYWCASRPEDDWMYSGTGFTGRRLSDGCVDGWSFTEFESAMVGGMGEGIAPCEGEGEIIYVPARVGADIDFSKSVRTIGKGFAAMPLVVKFGPEAKIDNVVLRLKLEDQTPTAEAVLKSLDADPAFKYAGNTLSIDADGDGVFGTTTASCDSSVTGDWTLTEYEDCFVLSCGEDTVDYVMYLPASDAGASVVLPEAMTFALSDTPDRIPAFIQRASEYDAINFSWYRRTSPDTGIASSTSSDIVTSLATAAATFGQLTYKGNKAGDLYISMRARTGKGSSYSFSNPCHFTLLPPEKPVERVTFAEDVVEAPLNSTIVNEMTIYPADATYTALTYNSSDTKVVTASATAIKTTKVAGGATITVTSTWNPEVKGSFEIASELRHPVTDFKLREIEADDDNVIVLHPKEMFGAIFDVEPADADIPDVNVTFSDYGTTKDNYILSGYRVNYWDESNTRVQFYEVSGHRAGEGKMIVSTTDGSNITKEYTIRVEEQDRTPLANGYTEGTIMLNEEWFGHTNGGLNYITPEGEMMYQVYERENPGMSFGCTSQFAIIWADKLIVISKQADDAGDPLRGGGRVVVADAKTLKRIGSLNDLVWGDETRSSDGRAVVGATPDKVYVGSNNGIYIVDLNNIKVTGKITDFDGSGSAGTDLYNGQIGDMVHAGKYVFGIKQNSGAFVIDVESDRVVKTFPELSNVQGVTQTADGNVWVADVVDGRGRFTCIDPASLEINEDLSVLLTAEVGYPVCGWGAWRNTPFVGSHSRNTIWFNTGGGIAGGSSKDRFYGWEVGSDPSELKPVFDLGEAHLTGSHKNVLQKTYGTLRYDERTGELFVMTTEDSASGHYRYNWTHFVDPETGEIVRTLALRPYYWFQCFPIFPDVHDAEISLDNLSVDVCDGVKCIDLIEYVSDADNIDKNICFSISAEPLLMVEDTDAVAADVKLDGTILTIRPKMPGTRYFTLFAESNGRRVSKSIPVSVTNVEVGVNDVAQANRTVWCDGQRIFVRNFMGETFRVYDTAGRVITSFEVDSEEYILDFGSHAGVYVIGSSDGFSTKIVIR